MTDRTAGDAADAAHLAPTRLADLDEGLLAASDARAARAHLQACARCTDVHAALADVRARLGALPAAALPPVVARSLDAALEAASVERAAATVRADADRADVDSADAPIDEAAASTESGSSSVRLDDRRRARNQRRMKVLQAAAAVVLVVGGGALGVRSLDGLGGGDDAGGQAATGLAPADRGAQEPSALQPGRVTASDTDYTPDRLAEQVRGVLARGRNYVTARNSAGEGNVEEDGAASDVPALPEPAAVRSCVDALTTGPARRPLAVDIATFSGRPAAVVVLRTPGDPASLDVFVVDRRCSASADRTLYFQRIAR